MNLQLSYLASVKCGLKSFIDQYFLLFMGIMASISIWMNYYDPSMQGLLPDYVLMREIILSGFDVSLKKDPAFPMWGYGWVMILTTNKAYLLILQQVAALCAVAVFTRGLKPYIDNRVLLLFKIVLMFSLPWYAIHSIPLANSFGISFHMMAIAFFIRGFLSDDQWQSRIELCLSGILYGLGQHFRSDNIYLCVVLIIAALLYFRRKAIPKIIIWVAAFLVMMLPWLIYTWHAVDTPLLTSTNGGHVFFIGLGQLPKNKWGITVSDSDPVMMQVLRDHSDNPPSSLSLEGGQILYQEWLHLITTSPDEFVRKTAYSFYLSITNRVYQGDFESNADGLIPATFQRVSIFTATKLPILSFLVMPLTIYEMYRKKDFVLLIAIISIAYQISVTTIGYYAPMYSSNVYLFYILCLCVGVRVYFDFFLSRLRRII
jgi:hypothetical protein